MFVYLDESGDIGFKFDRGSSRLFVVTLLFVDDPSPVRLAIDELGRRLGLGPRQEFRFVHTSHDRRQAFFDCFRQHDVSIRALVVDKRQMDRRAVRDHENFYTQILGLVLETQAASLTRATIVLDESDESRRGKRERATYLRRQLNTNPAARKAKIIHQASHSDSLIQAADMASGAIFRYYERGDETYLRRIRRVIAEIVEWPARGFSGQN